MVVSFDFAWMQTPDDSSNDVSQRDGIVGAATSDLLMVALFGAITSLGPYGLGRGNPS